MFTDRTYWDAPTWQVVVVALFVLGLFILQYWFLTRKLTIRQVIANTDTNLSQIPLFFFSDLSGLLLLNEGAHNYMEKSRLSGDKNLNNLLGVLKKVIDTEELFVDGWLDDNHTLVVVPHDSITNRAGVLAIVTSHLSADSVSNACEFINLESEQLRSQLAQLETLSEENWTIVDDDLVVNIVERRLKIKEKNEWEEMEIKFTQYQLLKLFLENAGKPLTFEEIFTTVWIDERIDSKRLNKSQRDKLRAQISLLRKLIEQGDSKSEKITTIRGYGYMFQTKFLSEE